MLGHHVGQVLLGQAGLLLLQGRLSLQRHGVRVDQVDLVRVQGQVDGGVGRVPPAAGGAAPAEVVGVGGAHHAGADTLVSPLREDGVGQAWGFSALK